MRANPHALLKRAAELSEDALRADDAAAAARAIEARLVGAGAIYVQVRRYVRPGGTLTSGAHWAAGGLLARTAPPRWFGSSSSNYICFEHNPLLGVVRDGLTRYRFSDLAPQDDARHRSYWDAFSDAGIAEGFGANAYARGGEIASIHVGLPTRDVAPDELAAMQLAAGIAVERIIAGAPPAARAMMPASTPKSPPEPLSATAPRLSTRERDVLSYVARGKTDWEIGTILGISETTARFHADNARRKLGASNRAHAVARFLAGNDW